MTRDNSGRIADIVYDIYEVPLSAADEWAGKNGCSRNRKDEIPVDAADSPDNDTAQVLKEAAQDTHTDNSESLVPEQGEAESEPSSLCAGSSGNHGADQTTGWSDSPWLENVVKEQSPGLEKPWLEKVVMENPTMEYPPHLNTYLFTS